MSDATSKPTIPSSVDGPSPLQGRLLVICAAALWSLSGAFTKTLTDERSPLGLHLPKIEPDQIAFFRVFFAGLVLLPLVRPRDLSFRPLMLVMVPCFAVMNYLFVSAMALGTAADAILLQYTAPTWVVLLGVAFLGEKAGLRTFAAVGLSLVGIAIIVWDGWQQVGVAALGLGAGVTYAGVVLCLRLLRTTSSPWLTILNHLCAALVLSPLMLTRPLPTLAQLGVLVVFGAVQMGIPYVLMARGLRSISSSEAGILTLVEPLLNPLWTFLVVREAPKMGAYLGGAFILGALLLRYWPSRRAGLR